ncbi:helix-turn-helix domain-containing protein [Ensifer soli]|uniref:helix-turn-helix domain-containing protein n=1 Tax=Ciceribacter sp. sgz301302 TaxID=3342379 RepID=UPI0035BA56FC
MVERKIFAGPRLRRMRMGLELTQTAMAEALGISPSYLNLIERNQRPLTVQLLLKLSSVYRIDLDELQEEASATLAPLRDVFADPLLSGELPGDQELIGLSDVAPNAVRGVVKLHRAYREQGARLKDLARLIGEEGQATALSEARLPIDEVREALEGRSAYFPAIDAAAEAFLADLPPGEETGQRLRDWLRRTQGLAVRTLPVHVMPTLRRRFDRHSMRLFLSGRLSAFDQLREVAMEAALIAFPDAIAADLDGLDLKTAEALRIARFELARHAAHALMMPYAAFHTALARARYDLDPVAAQFGVSFEQAASRLVTLQRPGLAAVPFFLMEIDQAGNSLRRAGAGGFPEARFGGRCPKLGLYAAFAHPAEILVDRVEMPDGAAFLTVARTVEGPVAGFGERVRRTALMLGADAGLAGETVYAAGRLPAVEGGTACRLCERQGCLARAEPPVMRPLGLDDMVRGLSSFDFQ